ncbi:hypothetical protein CKO24_14525, partial [Rhodothalassium salexigens DSM 2132]|nr:hypothetical protein [Rhodothalassium salexigens DSM 2132]
MLADDLEEILGPRLADWLRSYDYKTVAAMFPPTAPQTAKRWKAGSLPQVPHMAAMVERWGRPFVDHVFEPLLGDVPLERRAERIEADMRQLRKDLAHVDAATQRTLDLARAGDSVDGAGAGQRGLSPVAASG